jgi:hypothetical protein
MDLNDDFFGGDPNPVVKEWIWTMAIVAVAIILIYYFW